jgi:ribonuclease H / adenosylcobalamin/alpha-ribazole phosphatase
LLYNGQIEIKSQDAAMKRLSKEPLRFFIVRHGETADNLKMRYIGIRDEPLTRKGVKQARQAAAALSRLAIDLVVSSPLSRAAETALHIQKACGVELRTDSRLAEGSFGRWEGLTRSEVIKLGRSEAELLARWESDPSFAPPGGEAFEKVQDRVAGLANQLQKEHGHSSIVLVSHVGPIKALIAAALNIPLIAASRFFLDPGTISVVDWGERPVMRLFNSHAHQGWTSARWMTGA